MLPTGSGLRCSVRRARPETLMATLEETLLAEAQRQLEQQFSDLERLRTRAVSVLGVGGVVAGLFVGRLDQHLGVP